MGVGRPTRSPSSRASSTILETVISAAVVAKGSGSNDHNGLQVVDSYLRQLYGGTTAMRVLAAQGLGALPSFLPPSRGPDALRLAVEQGVVGSLTDVLMADDELAVQEACLMALATLLLSTAPYEDHSAPLRPQHLKLLGALVLRPEVMVQIGYLLTATTNSRVVLAAARLMAITAPYITPANDIYILDSRVVPALLSAAAARPDTGGRRTGGGGGGEGDGGGGGVPAAAPTPRDAAACVLALLTLAQTTPDLYAAVCTADFLQAVSVLYERCIDPDQTSDMVLPADAAALLLRAACLAPNPRWAARLPAGYTGMLERNMEESDVPECLVSFLAVEAANLRRLGEQLAEAAEGNAAAVVRRIGEDLEQLQGELRERRQQLAEARVAAQEAWRQLQAAEAEAARAQGEVAAAEAAVAAQRQRGGSAQAQRQARREAEAEAAAAAAEAEARRRDVDAAAAAVEELQREVAALGRAAAPLRWQSDRMAQLGAKMQAWRGEYGFKSRSKVKLSRPNTAMLTQVLSFLAARVNPAPAPERGASSPRGARAGGPPSLSPSPPPPPTSGGFPSSPEHAAALQAKLLEAGLVQAVLQLFTVLCGVQSLVEEVAALAADLALQPDLAAALEGAGGQLRREAEGLRWINTRAHMRLAQVQTEAARLRKALRLDLPLPGGSPPGAAVELGPGNGLSRGVRQEDVQQRLESLVSEAGDLTAALGDSEALVAFLQDRVQAITAASSSLADSYAAFQKAFPTQVAPATPATAPAAAAAAPPAAAAAAAARNVYAHGNNGHNGASGGDERPQAKPDNRALRPASRSILAKDPDHPAGHLLGLLSLALAPVTRGSVLNLPALVRQLLGRSPDGAAVSWPPSPASPPEAALAGRPGSRSESNLGSESRSRSTGSAVLAGGRPRSAGAIGPQWRPSASLYDSAPAARARPSSARSAGAGPNAERSYASGIVSPRGSGTHGGVANHLNGSGFALLLREKGAAAGAARPPLTAASSLSLELMASVSMPLAAESRRVVHQVVSSVLFDPVDADVLGPGVVRASLPAAASLALADGAAGSRRSAAYDSRSTVAAAAPAAFAEAAASGGGDGGDMSVLDALLMQSELLGGVMEALATLQTFAKSTLRACRQLPSALSFTSLQPGSLGPYMARLHGMWAGAIPRFPEMRVAIAASVAEIAQLALVPGSDFRAVYRDSGMLEALVAMLGGATRPGGKAGAKSAAGGGGGGRSAAGLGSGPGGGSPGPKPRYVGRLTATAPPTLRVSAAQQAEQAAAGQALRAISHAQSEVLVSIGQDEKLLARLSGLVLDHSMSWPARQSAADLLSDLVLGGGPGAEAAVAAGAYAGLVEMVNRDMYPFLNQDPRGSKETVVSALACMVAHPELLDGVLAAAQASHGPSSGLPLSNTYQVMSAILRSLWGVCWQVYTTFISDRTGHGRHVDPELICGLTSTAATAARELAVLADTVPEARRALINELGLRTKINATFLQAIKDSALHEALVELRKNVS